MWKTDNQGFEEETLFQTSRRGEVGQPGRKDSGQGGGWRTGWSHSHAQINWEKQLGSKTDHTTQDSSRGKESLKTSGWKTCGGSSGERNSSLTGEFVEETHRVLECTNPPTQESAPEGPNSLVGSGGSD